MSRKLTYITHGVVEYFRMGASVVLSSFPLGI